MRYILSELGLLLVVPVNSLVFRLTLEHDLNFGILVVVYRTALKNELINKMHSVLSAWMSFCVIRHAHAKLVFS